jgi:hypothetical protein
MRIKKALEKALAVTSYDDEPYKLRGIIETIISALPPDNAAPEAPEAPEVPEPAGPIYDRDVIFKLRKEVIRLNNRMNRIDNKLKDISWIKE